MRVIKDFLSMEVPGLGFLKDHSCYSVVNKGEQTWLEGCFNALGQNSDAFYYNSSNEGVHI